MEMVGFVVLLVIVEYFVLGFFVGCKCGDVLVFVMIGLLDFECILCV